LIQNAIYRVSGGRSRFFYYAGFVVSLLTMADDDGSTAHCLYDACRTIGGHSSEVPPNGGIYPINPLRAYLYWTVFIQSRNGAQNMRFREKLHELDR
jgi:hypothetical protein